MPTIYLIRHAQASFGTPEYDALSPLGRRQPAALHRALRSRGVDPDRVARGTLRRTRETCELCEVAAATPPRVDAGLDEYDHDEIFENYAPEAIETWKGATSAAGRLSSAELQVHLDRALGRYAADGDGGPCKESWNAFRDRSVGALADLADGLGSGETALAFTSAGVVAAICTHLLGASSAAFVAFNRVAVNTGITTLALGRGGTSLVSFNEHAHVMEGGRELLTYR